MRLRVYRVLSKELPPEHLAKRKRAAVVAAENVAAIVSPRHQGP